MKSKPDCILCVFRQALNTVRFVTPDPRIHEEVLRKVAAITARQSLEQKPTAISQHVYRIVSEVTGVKDPYKRQKKESNLLALSLLPGLRKLMARSADPLDVALHAAVAGNIIDLGIGHTFDLAKDIRKILREPFAATAIAAFRKEIKPGRRLLYLGDNAGEIVLDTLLVGLLREHGMDITYTVKSGPAINDAMREDARMAGMDRLARVIETGSDDIGVNWKRVSREFRKAFAAADVIISKGHGNFETCDDLPENLYFLLKAKCEIVAAALGVKLGDFVFTRHLRKHRRGPVS